MNKSQAALGIVLLAVVAGVGWWAYTYRVRISPQGEILVARHENELRDPVNEVNYACADGKALRVRVEVRPRGERGNAEVFLPDSSKLLLAQATSGSGIRYVNKGESFVLWMDGDTAFVDEGGVQSFKDCVLK